MTALYDEFTQAHLAVLDIPPAAEAKYEFRMLSIVKRILQAGPRVAILVCLILKLEDISGRLSLPFRVSTFSSMHCL